MNSAPSRCPPLHPAPLSLPQHAPPPTVPQLLRVQGEVRSPLIQVGVEVPHIEVKSAAQSRKWKVPAGVLRFGRSLYTDLEVCKRSNVESLQR